MTRKDTLEKVKESHEIFKKVSVEKVKQEKKFNKEQQILEMIFQTVDLLKQDFKNAEIFELGSNSFTCTRHIEVKLKNEEGTKRVKKIVKWVYKNGCLKRNSSKIISLTDFFISFFDDSKSVLYRLEINNREQVRGYIFLKSLKNKEGEKENEVRK